MGKLVDLSYRKIQWDYLRCQQLTDHSQQQIEFVETKRTIIRINCGPLTVSGIQFFIN
jgi:hypothetical protein